MQKVSSSLFPIKLYHHLRFGRIVFMLCCLFFYNAMWGQSQTTDTLVKEDKKELFKHGSKGFEFSSRDGNHMMQIEFRGQFRMATPYSADPTTADAYDEDVIYLGIRRARLKVGGYTMKPWLKYYLEYELKGSALLDFRLMVEKYRGFNVKVGQWKVQYNRERIISSGKQQTVERSIVTRPFTVDRQQGVSIYGNIGKKSMANFNYWVSIFQGEGIGLQNLRDNNLMYMSRLQWNPTGKPLGFSSSDIENHQKVNLLLAIAGVTNKSAYTRFSGTGGGQLEGFSAGAPGQYKVHQAMQESALKYKGLSWQQEFHWKQINDEINIETTEMIGGLFQLGYILNHSFESISDRFEVYGRYAFYQPDLSDDFRQNDEYTFGLNYFVDGHHNKFTLEASFLESSFAENENSSGMRYQLQWDVSF